jgi:hypothetical protein
MINPMRPIIVTPIAQILSESVSSSLPGFVASFKSLRQFSMNVRILNLDILRMDASHRTKIAASFNFSLHLGKFNFHPFKDIKRFSFSSSSLQVLCLGVIFVNNFDGNKNSYYTPADLYLR